MLLSTAKNLTVKSIIWQRKLKFFLPCPLVLINSEDTQAGSLCWRERFAWSLDYVD